MSDFFLEAFNAVSGSEFEEIPVSIEEFVISEDYLGLPELSEYQYQMTRAGTQIYTLETLIALYGEERGNRRYEQTCSECCFVLGKGSGKDHISTIICAYVIYLLLCLKNPQKYYGKPAGNAIDILNVATNSDQAKNVFFKNLRTMIDNCPWFAGKYNPPTQYSIAFDKSINLYSGHSERESFEGLNLFLAVLDEISAFAHTDSVSPEDVYNTYRDSVDSRFPGGVGKVLLLSFPRKLSNDFILDKYNEVVSEKTVVERKHILKLEPDLPDGIEGNEVEVRWEEDHIIKYRYPMIFALKRPTWEVNPTKTIDMYTRNFHSNMANALAKFAAMPTEAGENAFFKNQEAINNSFVQFNPVDENGIFLETFVPKAGTKYFMHVDLSQVHDRCAVSMAHVESWVNTTVGDHYSDASPVVMVDAVRWWVPSHEEPMDYQRVIDYILAIKKRGFDIGVVTFDRWHSMDTMNHLNNFHIKTELLSVGNKHYDDFLSVLYGSRLIGPNIKTLKDEMFALRYFKGKVDHPSGGYKDLSDATCGAIYNAISKTSKPHNTTIETVTYADMVKKQRQEALDAGLLKEQQTSGVIRPPRKAPPALEEYLRSMHLI